MPQNYSYLHGPNEQLIQKCLKNDRAAQNALYKLYCNKMLGVCMWYAKSREEAEEILQDGFIKVFKYLQSYSGKGSMEGWIRKIMVNTALLKYKGKKNSNLRLVTELDEDAMLPAKYADGESNLAEKQLLELVQSLTPVYRMVFNLFVLEGFKHKEIAGLLGITEGTSKSNLSDARAILQQKIIGLQKTASI